MEENKNQKIIMLSLGSMFVGSLLFIFGISFSESLILLICEYAFAMMLFIAAFLALKNHYKNNREHVFMYLILLDIFLSIFATYALINQL